MIKKSQLSVPKSAKQKSRKKNRVNSSQLRSAVNRLTAFLFKWKQHVHAMAEFSFRQSEDKKYS